MEKKLVIVESPAKAKTIGKILGKDYIIRASMGHIRDLPERELGVDIANGFTPQYVDTLLGTGDVIGDVAVRNLVADWEMDGFSVSGTLSVAENATVELKNLPRCIENGSEIVIVRSADEISGQANLRNAKIVGETPSRKLKIKVKVGDGKVSVKFMPEGFWMILR